MSSAPRTTLYDLSRKGVVACWSPNVWKTRLVLNFKSIPYTTLWVPHPEITSTLQALGLPPNPPRQGGPPQSPFTLPAVTVASGEHYMDSLPIAEKLDDAHHSPSLHLDTNLHVRAQELVNKIGFGLFPIIVPNIGRNILQEEYVPAWRAKREAMFGMSIEDFEAIRGGETAWAAVKPGFEELGAFLGENKRAGEETGPFLLGEAVSYGDLILAALLESLRRVSKDIHDRFFVEESTGRLRTLYDAVRAKGLFERDQ